MKEAFLAFLFPASLLIIGITLLLHTIDTCNRLSYNEIFLYGISALNLLYCSCLVFEQWVKDYVDDV